MQLCRQRPKNPAFLQVFFLRWRRVRKELFSSRVGSADIRRGSHARAGNGVISYSPYPNPIAPHKMRDFLCVVLRALARDAKRRACIVKHPPKCHLKFFKNSTSANSIAVEKFRILCYNKKANYRCEVCKCVF